MDLRKKKNNILILRKRKHSREKQNIEAVLRGIKNPKRIVLRETPHFPYWNLSKSYQILSLFEWNWRGCVSQPYRPRIRKMPIVLDPLCCTTMITPYLGVVRVKTHIAPIYSGSPKFLPARLYAHLKLNPRKTSNIPNPPFEIEFGWD